MKRFAILPLLIAFSVLSVACPSPREPGPHENEYGQIFYWGVVDSSIDISENCTDADGWQDQFTPIYGENSFVVYKVADDGETAVFQSCDTTQGSTCTDDENPRTMNISGSTLTHVADATREEPPGDDSLSCDFTSQSTYTIVDQGDAMEMKIQIDFGLDGEDCEGAEAFIEDRAPNGEGLEGCSVVYTIDTTYRSIY